METFKDTAKERRNKTEKELDDYDKLVEKMHPFLMLRVAHTDFDGAHSIQRRCYYGKDTFEYVLEYGRQFWKTYENEKKFLSMEFIDAHEGTGEVVKYLDAALVQMLSEIDLEDTVLILTSDHGWHMQSVFFYADAE